MSMAPSKKRPRIDPKDRSWPAVIPISGIDSESRKQLRRKRDAS